MSTIVTPTERLAKILHLEAEAHLDKAVVGGLACYAETWTREAGATFGPGQSAWVAEIEERLRTYSDLPDVSSRREALASLLDLIRRGAHLRTTPPSAARQVEQPASPKRHGEAQREPAAALHPEGKPQPTKQPQASIKPEASYSAKRQVTLESPTTALHDVGPKRAERLTRLGLHTIRDMLFFLPRRYNDYSRLKSINRLEYGEDVTIMGSVRRANLYRTRARRPIFKAVLTDGTGSVQLTWFNQPHLARAMKPGQQIVVSGRVDEYLGQLCFTSPEWEPLREELLHTNRIVPVYPLTEGIGGKWLRRLMRRTVTYWARLLPDDMPTSVLEAEGLLDLETAVLEAHFPTSGELLTRARQRLAFNELFVLQLALLRQRRLRRSQPGQPVPVQDHLLQAFLQGLPYQLTGAQQRALHQVIADLRSDQPMTRLLQGDVGSGKTVVATAAMALAAATAAQAALMAPTEILARQHYQTITALLRQAFDVDLNVQLLTGSVAAQERDAVYAGLANGDIDIVVGTHALIQETVLFRNLVLAIVDEQHRFGVRQRGALRQKGYHPHLLVMTATPIPRSLQLTVWGHMDVSVIDQMPPGRTPITTRLILPAARERAYAFVRKQIESGRQAFIICPLVEESDHVQAKAAVEEYERLQQRVFPDLRLGLLHGRMTGEEKDAGMARFARGELDILVATSIIEVGIDVPNATVMLIEGADRFGLAQLHQFRGRVGRGEHPAYCLLVSDSSSDQAQERLKAVETTDDGFELANKDLEMRGPGEFLGTRQSGFSEAVLAMDLASVADLRLVQHAREAARRLIDMDPLLENPAHRPLAERVKRVLEEGGSIS
jgi:ATP-dependent DNA helicase RecG